MKNGEDLTPIHHLLLQSPFVKDVGLFHGKMGITLFFYHYSRHVNNAVYADYADELLDNSIMANMVFDTFYSFVLDSAFCAVRPHLSLYSTADTVEQARGGVFWSSQGTPDFDTIFSVTL